ncbi:hypothetical protein FBU30_010907 [Linnemannia zychae]|nr:hypothetical protein FBU30_010907 [Linnemannia zychae]
MWKAARELGRQDLISRQASQSSLSLLAPYSQPRLQGRSFQTGTARAINNNGGVNGSGNQRGPGGKILSDKITIDPATKLRMEIRKEAMGNNNSGAKSFGVNNGGDKWARSPDHATRSQESPYRRAYEEANNRSGSFRPSGGNNSGSRRQQQGQNGRSSGRYYDNTRGSAQGQQRSTPPPSFATDSAFGFSAPAPAARSKATSPPSSFATSSGFGAPKPGIAPASKARPKPSSPPPSFATSSSFGFGAPVARPAAQQSAKNATTQPTAQPIVKVEIKKETVIAPTSNTTTTPASTPAVAAKTAPPPATTSAPAPTVAPVANTFTKSTRSAKENAKIQVEQRAKNRKQKKNLKPTKDVFIPEAISVSNLAGLLGARITHFENTMRAMSMEITRHDHILTSEEASLLALEYNVNPIVGSTEKLFDLTSKPEPEDMSIYPLRPPVVTIMGHVDHGKTTLLDSLRKTSVAAGEAGGITQHIGSFSVLLPSKQRITFLDTPGHAAFSAMRARGAHTTDIVVLVVAAEDGVMPQTAEAIKHAEEAGVPLIVAINKCDKYGAEPEKAKQALLKYGITVEDLGGETQCVEVSGLTGKNLDKLEEAILTLSEVLDLRAEVDIPGEGHIIESQIEKGRGSVATVLVKRGTLRVGDTIVAGDTWCKVKALVNDTGKNVKEAPPGTPVKVMGWKDLPKAGDEMLGAESEEQAKQAVTTRALKKERQEQLKTLVAVNEKRRVTAEEEDEEKQALRDYKRKVWLFHQGVLDEYPQAPHVKKQLSVAAMAAKEEEESDVKNLRVLVKGDVSGTVEAVRDAVSGLPANQVKVSVVQSGVGNITEGDIQFASSSNALLLGFNVKADKKLLQTARQLGVTIKSYSVIYKLLDDVKVEMAQLLPKDIEIQVVGEAKIAQIFPIKMKGGAIQNVAGCRITNGSINRKEDVRIVRNGETIFEGRLTTLKRVKEDIQEAKKGTECGMEFEGFQDLKEGDMIQSIKKNEVLRKL